MKSAGVTLAAAAALLAFALTASQRGDAAPAAGKHRIAVPAGFRVSVFVRGLERPTALAFGPDRRLYVAQETGEILVLDRSGGRRVFARGFRTPLGLTWFRSRLYVSTQGSLQSVGRTGSGRRVVVGGLPYGRHQQDNVVAGPDGRLYFGSGSTCDVCRERDRRSAAILSVRPNGTDLRVFATGLRNPYGLAFQPKTKRLFVSVNNRDDLGIWEPAETIVVARRGANFGWPDCWPSWKRRRLTGACAGVTAPVAYLEPHSSANGIAFYTGRSFPRRYRGRLFVAEWGQYDSARFGRKVVEVDPKTGRARVFADGFDHPLAVAVDWTGALLVADWGLGTIHRISARRSVASK